MRGAVGIGALAIDGEVVFALAFVQAAGVADIGSAGQLTASLTTAEAATLDVLSVAWSLDGVVRTTSHHRIVGGFLFAISEVTALGGLASYDNATLLQFRDATIDMVELWTGVSWNPAYDLEQFQGYGRCTHASTFRPLRTIRSLSLDGTTQSVSDLKVNPESGLITSLSALCGWTILGVEHGFDEPPDDLRNAAIQACKFALLQSKSALGQRVRSISDEQGTRTFSFAGKNHPTGIDDIDSVIMSHDMRDPY